MNERIKKNGHLSDFLLENDNHIINSRIGHLLKHVFPSDLHLLYQKRVKVYV